MCLEEMNRIYSYIRCVTVRSTQDQEMSNLIGSKHAWFNHYPLNSLNFHIQVLKLGSQVKVMNLRNTGIQHKSFGKFLPFTGLQNREM